MTSESGTDSLEGEAADAFRDIVDKVADSLGDLPGVCDDAHDALADHYSRLADLRAEAASALARARTRWDAHEEAVRTLSSRRSSHNSATADVDSLPPAGADPAADADRTAAEDAAEQSGRLLAAAQGALDSAADDLRASRDEWDNLRSDEDELNDRTADRLDDISLGDLSDPSWWESILGSAFDLVMDLTGLDALIDLVAAIASGDWAAALWALRELLDRVLLIVSVIALFTPLGPLVLALVALKMATSIALYSTQWPSPETGQTVGLVDVAMDGADLLGAAGDVIIAGRAATAVNAATPPPSAVSGVAPPTPPAGARPPDGAPTRPRPSTCGRRGARRVRRQRSTSTPGARTTGWPRMGRRRYGRPMASCAPTRVPPLEPSASALHETTRRTAARPVTSRDTAVTGQANPPAGWLDMPGHSNQVAGGGLGPRVGRPALRLHGRRQRRVMDAPSLVDRLRPVAEHFVEWPADPPSIVEEIPPLHRDLLRQLNGFTVQGGALRMFGIGRGDVLDLEWWNDRETWRFAWDDRVDPFVFFAESAWGDQFAYRRADGGGLEPTCTILEGTRLRSEPLSADVEDFAESELLRIADEPYGPAHHRCTRAPRASQPDSALDVCALDRPRRRGGRRQRRAPATPAAMTMPATWRPPCRRRRPGRGQRSRAVVDDGPQRLTVEFDRALTRVTRSSARSPRPASIRPCAERSASRRRVVG